MGRRSLKTIDVEGVDDLAERHYTVSGTPSPLRTGSQFREGDHTGGPAGSATLNSPRWNGSTGSTRPLFNALGHVPPAEYEAGCYSSPVPAEAGTQRPESP